MTHQTPSLIEQRLAELAAQKSERVREEEAKRQHDDEQAHRRAADAKLCGLRVEEASHLPGVYSIVHKESGTTLHLGLRSLDEVDKHLTRYADDERKRQDRG